MMKYRLKQEQRKVKEYTQICIRCGKKRVYIHRVGLLPRPNTTLSIREGNIINCWVFNDHSYYFEDELESYEP